MIDCLLLAKEMSVLVFGDMIKERHLLNAVTSAAAQTEYNYERLELLGNFIHPLMSPLLTEHR